MMTKRTITTKTFWDLEKPNHENVCEAMDTIINYTSFCNDIDANSMAVSLADQINKQLDKTKKQSSIAVTE